MIAEIPWLWQRVINVIRLRTLVWMWNLMLWRFFHRHNIGHFICRHKTSPGRLLSTDGDFLQHLVVSNPLLTTMLSGGAKWLHSLRCFFWGPTAIPQKAQHRVEVAEKLLKMEKWKQTSMSTQLDQKSLPLLDHSARRSDGELIRDLILPRRSRTRGQLNMWATTVMKDL